MTIPYTRASWQLKAILLSYFRTLWPYLVYRRTFCKINTLSKPKPEYPILSNFTCIARNLHLMMDSKVLQSSGHIQSVLSALLFAWQQWEETGVPGGKARWRAGQSPFYIYQLWYIGGTHIHNPKANGFSEPYLFLV